MVEVFYQKVQCSLPGPVLFTNYIRCSLYHDRNQVRWLQRTPLHLQEAVDTLSSEGGSEPLPSSHAEKE